VSNGGALLQIVPGAPADCGGVGDYSRQLARRLRELHGITSTFVSAAPTKLSRSADGFEILSPLSTISDVIDSPTALLLHYVNYGYNPQCASLASFRAASVAKRQRRAARDSLP
jgi:hypothetical protein